MANKVLEAALAKLKRRKSQPPSEREAYTEAEGRALLAHVESIMRAQKPRRAERKAMNKAAWRAGDRSRWGGENRSG